MPSVDSTAFLGMSFLRFFAPAQPAKRDKQILAAIREEQARLPELTPSLLAERSESARLRIATDGVDDFQAVVHAFVLADLGLRQALGISLYDVQILASLALARGAIAEMATGEGKTYSCAPAAVLHGLTGRGVHVVTTNAYLAQRDYELLASAYRAIDLTSSLIPERAQASEKRLAYQSDIAYSTGYELGFDYLRDQLTLRTPDARRLGQSLLQRLHGKSAGRDPLIQRPHYYAIVDEIDNVLLDDASSPLILSGAAPGEAPDAEVHRVARDLIYLLNPASDYVVDSKAGSVQLTPEGIERIHDPKIPIPLSQLTRTWTEYIEQALRAQLLIRKDVHYIVSDGTVQIVDASTGRIFADRVWQDGLHQAIEAKEGVTITADRRAMAQVTRQRYFRRYQRLAGMTGTAQGCEREFQQVYRLPIQPIPLRKPTQRRELPTRFFVSTEAKSKAIVQSVAEIHATGRPILIGTRSIEDSQRLADLLAEAGVAHRLLNGKQDEEEAAVVGRAGDPGAVTIATNLAGRGTDIKLSEEVIALGGLHVIAAECHDSPRVDRQLLGRCGRQGDPGTTQTFVSADDVLIQRHGPWLARFMARHASPQGEVMRNLTPYIRRMQQTAERIGFRQRSEVLRRDLASDALFPMQASSS